MARFTGLVISLALTSVGFETLLHLSFASVSRPTPVTGSELYRLNCAGCHGTDRRGHPPVYPSLRGVDSRLTAKEIHDQIAGGGKLMPAMSHLSGPEIDALVSFLLGKEKAAVALGMDLAEVGRGLFLSNCSACHQATTYDPPPSGIPSEHPMTPAPLAGATRRFSRKQFDTILDVGPGIMPGFRHLESLERETLWAYLKTLEGKGEPRGPTMLEIHPQMLRMEHPMEHPREHPGTSGRDERQGAITAQDIATAIRDHIDRAGRAGGGYYLLLDDRTGALLNLKLTKVHEDKLARVEEGVYFACVDMKEKNGRTYDVDFFLKGAGSLDVTEATVHKVQGAARYHWILKGNHWERQDAAAEPESPKEGFNPQ